LIRFGRALRSHAAVVAIGAAHLAEVADVHRVFEGDALGAAVGRAAAHHLGDHGMADVKMCCVSVMALRMASGSLFT